MKVTLKDIAAELGVSHATISLALNNSPKVAKATREKVLAKAKEMGYQVSPYVSALMAARRRGRDLDQAPVIALVTPNRSADYWKERHHIRRFIESCTETAGGLGIQTKLFWIGEEGMTARRMNEIFFHRGIRGAVLMTHGRWGERMDHAWSDLATVTYGARELRPNTDWVGADFYGNMELVLNELIAHKYTKVGFTMDKPFHYQHHNRWLSAYLKERYYGGIASMEPWLDAQPDFEGFKKWFQKWTPEVIVCVQPATIIEWLQQLGLRVPQDVSVVTIGTAERGGKLSGIVENTYTCGKLALQLLVDRIHRGDFGTYADPYHITVKGKWNPGETLKRSHVAE